MKKWISCFIFFLIAGTALSQNKDQLRQKRNQILNEIKETKALLAKTNTEKRATLADLQLLQEQVSKQEELIKTIGLEVRYLNGQIRQTNRDITITEKELTILKESYSKTVVSAYKKRNTYDQLLFVLSADDFNNAFRRINYLKKYSAHKSKQADVIRTKKKELEQIKKKLLASKKEKDALLQEQKVQQTELQQAKTTLNKALDAIKADESSLLAMLTRKRNEAAKLEKEIERIIAREIEAERKRVAALNPKTEAKPNTAPKTSESFALTPEAARLSKTFAKNRGKLPWPVDKGVVSQKFGENASKELRGIKTNNNGIDIRTEQGSTVQSLFDGEVRSITTIPGYNKVVIVGHGEYFTVYGKLNSVNVEVGDEVNTKDKIGVADTKDGVTEVHLEIWKGTTKMNPASWIAK